VIGPVAIAMPPLLASALVIGSATIIARRRAGTPHRRVPVELLTVLAVAAQCALVWPVLLLSDLTHRWLTPDDDWNDIAAGGAAIIQVVLVPAVAIATAWIGVAIDARQRRSP